VVKEIFLIIDFVVFLILTIIIHEIGHWLMMWFFGFKNVSLKISVLGEVEIGRNYHKKMNLTQTFLIQIIGILFGWLFINLAKPVLFSYNTYLLFVFIYLFLCYGDIILINRIVCDVLHTKNVKKYLNMTLFEFNELEWKKYKQEVEKYD